MGFCRRCGNIACGSRCKCGGAVAAPTVQWPSSKGQSTDKWSQMYTSKDKSPPRSPAQLDNISANLHVTTSGEEGRSSHRWPRSHTNSASRPLSLYTTGDPQPASSIFSSSSQSKNTVDRDRPTGLISESEVLRQLDEPELSRVYGSVLQPKETRPTFSCGICAIEFQPDATIYPDPTVEEGSDRFLCKLCFDINGGSKGDCPACRRPVLILRSEGGFVEASGNFWHKSCFCCDGCHKNLGDAPLVDLFGRPSCADCFDSCLKRNSARRNSVTRTGRGDNNLSDRSTAQPSSFSSPLVEKRSTIAKSREGSPCLEELTQRLNAMGSCTPQDSPRSATNLPHDSPADGYLNSPLTRRTLERSKFGDSSPSLSSSNRSLNLTQSDTPSRSRHPVTEKTVLPGQTTSPAITERNHVGRPSPESVEEMKRRLMRQSELAFSLSSPSTPPKVASPNLTPSRIPRMSVSSGSPTLRHVTSTSSLRSPRMSWTPSTPDLVPDVLDTMTQSSGPSSPPALSPQIRLTDNFGSNTTKEVTPTKIPRTVTPRARDSTRRLSIPAATLSTGSLCAKCGGSLFASGGTGRFVTVPEFNSAGPSKTYHTECFRCAICDGPFKELPSGKAVFVRTEGGACHVECAPQQQTHAKSTLISSPIKSAFADLPPSRSSPLVPLADTIPTSVKTAPNTELRDQIKGSPRTRGSPSISSRFERVPPPTAAASSPSTRFGSSLSCPGCQKAVSPMELGVIAGPQGSKWHSSCLVCGGTGLNGSRQDKSRPGCGKRLDSAAKQDAAGGVWCRECLLILPGPIRNPLCETPLVPSHTGRSTGGGPFSKQIGPQHTGATTIARQFTGLRTGDPALMRQLTGGGLSPTRQLAGSPTRQRGSATPRPRPKSVIGIRSGKSIDEGRGMFLVKQMTGSFGM